MELLGIFIRYPLGALLVAGVFAALWLHSRRALPGVVAAIWAAYAVYEYLMHTRVLCSGECNIRVDLLLIYPLLVLLTIAGVAEFHAAAGPVGAVAHPHASVRSSDSS